MSGPKREVHIVAVEGHALTRRGFLLASSSLLTGCALGSRTPRSAVPESVTLPRFMIISRVLTGVGDLQDEASGGQYLAALQPRAPQLTALWQVGGFAGQSPPGTLADLVARGVYRIPDLADMADTIANNWYSGTYIGLDREPQVATYTRALAWRTLGYRQAGPSACGGVFGHWAEKPAED